jgi:hypothetical protein
MGLRLFVGGCMSQRLLIGLFLALAMTTECLAQTDVGFFRARCKQLQYVIAGKKKSSISDQKNLFWCVGHLSGILDGYRIGLLVRDDVNSARTRDICPPKNTTDVDLFVVVFNELEAQAIPNSTTLATAVIAILSSKWACS